MHDESPDYDQPTPDQPTPRRKKRSFSLSLLRKYLIRFYVGFSRLILTLVVLLALYNVVKTFNVDRLQFESFSVPASLDKRGYTGKEIAGRISDKVNIIRNSVKEHVKIYRMVKTGSEEDEIPEFDVPGASISLHEVIQYLRMFFGISNDRVYGSIVEDGDRIRMTVRITGVPSVMFSGRVDQIESLIEKAAAHVLMQLEPFSLALYYKEQKNIRGLRQMIDTMIEDGADEQEKVSIHIINSFIFNLQENYEAAVAEAERAVKLNPRHSYALHNYSIALVDVNRLQQAAEVMQRLVKVYPDWSTFNNLAYVEMLLGNLNDATVHVKKSIEMDAECEQCYDTWGSILLAQHQYDEAIAKVKMAMNYSTPNHFAYYFRFLGDIERKAGYIGAAKNHYQAAIQSAPKSPYAKQARQSLKEMEEEMRTATNSTKEGR